MASRPDELASILATAAVRAVYQPIVVLESGEIVAYEALARGPAGSPLERPDQLFQVARETGRLAELDWACRVAAARGARDGGLTPPLSLFLNAEPETLGTGIPAHLHDQVTAGTQALQVVMEVTERAVTNRPAHVLAGIHAARALGCAIGLDDVGANPGSLALLPFLRPDVIKLDLRLIQNRPSAEIAQIANAVIAEAERTGAAILAEGIETPAHVETAGALNATLGQGWLFGRPGPLPPTPKGAASGIRSLEPPRLDTPTSPFALARTLGSLRPASKALLFTFSSYLEQEAAGLPEPPVILATYQDMRFFSPARQQWYARLAERAAFVGVFAAGMEEAPAPNIRGAPIDPDDALRGEWNVLVLSPHFAGALIAKDLGDQGPERERRFTFTVTYNREIVLAAMRSLMQRITPAST